MRKTVYYLIANVVSTLAAYIVLLCICSGSGITPVTIGLNNGLVAITSGNDFIPLVIALPVAVLSIILACQDLTAYADCKKINKEVPFTKLKNIVMGIITILAIFYTWFCIVLYPQNYGTNDPISIPLFFTIGYVVAIALMICSPLISKLNGSIGATAILTAILLIVSGILCNMIDEWYVPLICYLVTGVVTVALVVLSLIFDKKQA